MATDTMTPEQVYVAALEQAVEHGKLLLSRLAAMERSGVLSSVAADAVRGWSDRLTATHSTLPPKPDSLKTEQELAFNA